MIVRIATEGQYEVGEADRAQLSELDARVSAAITAGDEEGFSESFARLLAFVRSAGQPVEADHLAGSDMILPPPDVTLSEAAAEFSGEGLLPS